jgi:hypothetical protein
VRTDDTRDQAVERLLRRSLEIGSRAEASPDCLDAETFAAWTDGTLRGAALATVEAHVAGCGRCQSMAAIMMHHAPASPEATPWWRKSLRSAWLVPLTAGAAAVALWSVVPNRPPLPAQPTASVAPAEQTLPESKAQSEPALADRLEARADKDSADGRRQTAEERPQTERKAAKPASNESRLERPAAAAAATDAAAGTRPLPSTPSATAPAAPAAPAGAPARPAAEAESPARTREVAGALMKQDAFAREVSSRDPAVRWRLGAGGAIDRTEDGGKTWTRLSTGVTAELISGASPSPSICWVVGRNGTVLRSIDGRSWARVNIPEAADLVTVEAVDASTAVVSTSDGRRFRTSDGGQTWIK